MIRTVGDFLLQLKKAEAAKLAAVGITHRPTIGDMYEGLSKDLLCRVIPAELQLQIVSGFVVDGAGEMSGQIDCMLAQGAGDRIPYTDDFVWHVKNVIAVFEIKKTLYGAELVDAVDHLNDVRELEASYFRTLRSSSDPVQVEALASGYRAFAETTGFYATHDTADSLPAELQQIFHVLTLEPFKFIAVIFGFQGFRTEAGFRKALTDELSARIGRQGSGPRSLPQLIVSGDFSLCKANGQPFVLPLQNGKWPVLFSSAVNPLVLLLEYLWTRLGRQFQIGGMWGDDLDTEVAHALLFAIPCEQNERRGWLFEYAEASEPKLRQLPDYESWQPCELTVQQAAIVQMLGAGATVSIDDEKLTAYLAEEGVIVDDLVRDLVATRLVAVEGDELQLVTESCEVVFLGDRIYAAENNSGRLTRWLERALAQPEQAD